MPSLVKTCRGWLPIVFGDRNSWSATCRFVWPAVTSRTTASSESVRPAQLWVGRAGCRLRLMPSRAGIRAAASARRSTENTSGRKIAKVAATSWSSSNARPRRHTDGFDETDLAEQAPQCRGSTRECVRRKDVRRVECSARPVRIGDGPGPERVDPGAAGTPHVRAAKSRVAGKVVRGGAVGLGRQAGEHVARKPLGRAHRRAESEQFSHLADSAGSALRCGARCRLLRPNRATPPTI